jgi:hypothetical protein
MNAKTRAHVAKLLQPRTLTALARFGVVVAAETALSPLFWAASAASPNLEPVLALQNRLRQRALRWLKPEFFRDCPPAPRARE